MNNIKVILKFLRPHWKLALAAPLLVLLEVVAEVIQPELMSEIVNKAVVGGDQSVILPLGAKMFITTLIGLAGGILSIYAAGKVSYSFGADIRKSMFEKITQFSFENLDKMESASLITRMTNDVTRVQQVVQASMRLLFRAPFLFVGAFFMVLSMNASITGILLALLPILLFSIVTILRKSYPLFMKVQEKTDKLNAVTQENLAGIRVIKAYVREDGEKERFAEANNDLTGTSLKARKIMMLMTPSMSLAVNIGIVLVIWVGGIKVDAGEMNIGEIMACTNYLSQILFSLMMASMVIMNITEAQASMARIQEVLGTQNKPTDQGGDLSLDGIDELEFDNVFFKYEGKKDDGKKDVDRMALKGISFKLKKGETLAIIGGTGSGKTSLVNLIPRFYDASSGCVKINGEDIKSYKREEIRKQIGTVMQKPLLFSESIENNIRWGKSDATKEEIKECCENAQIDDFISSLEDGYNYQLGQSANNLSGGQKQRISIARTLIRKPSLIILDDSLSAVDFKTEAAIRHVLTDLKSTKIIIAQRISSIKEADKILLLENGAMVGFGTHDELIQNNSVYQEIYNSQTN
ncbi:MAG: ABC transporter ATP-binding protein/permease [Paludibacteraceae bacterium]|nr:ABC transporter ATP-binding protein/permease [Paludibacteraceae bacterium]